MNDAPRVGYLNPQIKEERNGVTHNASESAGADFILHVQLLNTIEQSVIATDLEGIVIFWNQFAQKLYGWSADEAVGLNIIELTTPKLNSKEAEEIMAQLRRGKSWTGEFVLQRKDGTTFPAQITNSPLFNDKKQLIGVVGLSNDITERKRAEQALLESENRYRMLVEQASDGIHTYDLEGNFIETNSKLCEMLGYNSQELLRLNVKDLVPTEDLNLNPIRFDELSKGKTLIRERRIRRKDGTVFPVEISGKMIQNGILQAIVRDITERKRVEALIEAQKQSLEMVVKGAPLPHVLTYLTGVVEQQTGGQAVASIQLLDSEGCLHNGASPNLPESYLQAIDGIKANINVGTCSAAAASGEVVITRDIAADPKWNGLSHLLLEIGLKAAWIMPIIARDGHVLGTFGTYFRECREPTAIERQVVEILGRTAALAIEGKQRQEELRNSENQLRLITDAMPLLVSYVDKHHRYRFVNRTYTDWFGLPPEEVVGKHLTDVLGHAAYQAILPQIEKVLIGEEVSFERLIPYKNGERFISLNYVPDKNLADGQIKGFHAFVQDITERRKAQEALQRSREELEKRVQERTRELEKSNEARIQVLHQLVTVQEDERQRIARDLHDQLGQQMTALRLKLEVLKRMCVGDEEFEKQVYETQKVARQLDSDVDFLAWQMRPTALDYLGIVAALDNYIQQWSARFDISVEFDASRFGKTHLTPETETNVYRIAQEGLNNVYKHAQASSVNVFLERRDNFGVLIIEDDGIGFDESEPNQTGETTKGMGLIGMHERAALVGGTLEIESAKGVGTTVYARFPVSSAIKERENE